MSDKLNREIEKELKYIKAKESELQRAAMTEPAAWRQVVTGNIPEKSYVALRAAFATGFNIIFKEGIGIIEKTYDKEALKKQFAEDDSVIHMKKDRFEIKRLRREIAKSDKLRLALTTLEGVGLGVLGIGLPDIVIFIGFLLKSIYETSLRYGYDYDRPEERLFLLKLMETSVQKQKRWEEGNAVVDDMIEALTIPNDDQLTDQIGKTADALAVDMLVLKFIQGLPVVGIFGGMANPVYYRKIMTYTRLKYHKRYLKDRLKKGEIVK